jgi:hypothetical protein
MAHIKWPHLLSLLKSVLPDFSQRSTRWTSASLRTELLPVSTPLQDGFRFFHHLSPYLQQHALRLTCPKGRSHGVTTFRVFDIKYLRPTLSADGNVARVGRSAIRPNHPLTVLVQASQLLWLVYVHDSSKCSLTLAIVSYPNPSPGWSFQERFHLAASTPFA